MKTESRGYNLKTNVNNFKISYDDIGESKIPIIFLHGFPFDKSMWVCQMDSFKSTRRVIVCNIRGFGESKDEKSMLSIDLFGEDLIMFMNTLNVDKAILCGLSMGGYIALNVANKFPDRFEALILCDTQCIADTTEVKVKRYKVIDEILANGTTKFNEAFVKSVFHPDTLSQRKELVTNLNNVVKSNSQHIITAGLRALAERYETCSVLTEITIPTLIICGREDTVTPLAQSEFLNKHIKGSILRIIENAGHVSNLEQPEVFNKHIQDFLVNLVGFEEQSIS